MKNAVLLAAVCVFVVVGSVAGQVDKRLVGKWCYDVPGDIFGFYSGLDCYEFRANGTFTETESGGFDFSGRWKANGSEITMPTPKYDNVKLNYRFNREGTMLEMGIHKYRKVPTDAEKAAMRKAEEVEKAKQAAIEAERARQAVAEAERVRAEQAAQEALVKFTDNRDGKIYKKIVIGTQIWMAENLNYNATNSKCYKNDERDCAEYGRLYNWNTAMNGSPSSEANPSGVQGVCPSGWHLPSDAEWTTLMDYVGGSSTAGKKLKSTNGWYVYNIKSGNGSDEFGFTALPGGYGYSDGLFHYAGHYGYWWSSTEDGASYAWNRNMYNSIENVNRNVGNKTSLYSVRCVAD